MSHILAPLSPNARLRYDVVRQLLEHLTDARSFLEIGCGQGALATILAQQYDYVGYEPDETSFRVAQDRMERVRGGQIVNAPLPGEPERTYDIVAAFEVLEHMEDDAAVLEAWVKWIRPGGHLVLSVPAHPGRFAPWDEYAGHFRRYTRDGLTSLLVGAGMTNVVVLVYGFPLGHILESVRNEVVARRLKRAPDTPAARTAGSGRVLQLNRHLAPLVWAGTAPFRYMQRPFAGGDLGTGFVARAKTVDGTRS